MTDHVEAVTVEDAIMLAGRCGHHFNPYCQSCVNAKDATDEEIRRLHAAIATRTQANETMRAEVERLSDVLDTERYKVAIGVQAIARAVQGRKWLSEPGRGSYTYDDERYQQEFGAALDEIHDALKPLQAIAQDWSDCPRDPLRVEANRRAALSGDRA